MTTDAEGILASFHTTNMDAEPKQTVVFQTILIMVTGFFCDVIVITLKIYAFCIITGRFNYLAMHSHECFENMKLIYPEYLLPDHLM